jgi:hypothetical protein
MFMAMMQQSNQERQHALEFETRSHQQVLEAQKRSRQQAIDAEQRSRQQAVEAAHREQLIQKDMDFELMRMKAEQDLAAERARVRALQDANMQAMMEQFMKYQR